MDLMDLSFWENRNGMIRSANINLYISMASVDIIKLLIYSDKYD
jgi:hypothetical protein